MGKSVLRDDRRIIIGVLTFHRPGPLTALLPLLDAEAARHESTAPPHQQGDLVEVLVVDNDPHGSAGPVVSELSSRMRRPVRYAIESRPGISAARNRALDEARSSDLLVFIDDDETPEQGWLGALIRTYDEYGSAAVAGPVVSRFMGEADPWVVSGRYFDRTHHEDRPDGSLLDRAASNNLLLDLRVVRRLGLRFDDAYGLSGGEDSLFTGRLTHAGEQIRWASQAVVVDHVPLERLSRGYAVKRTFDLANGSTRVEFALVTAAHRARLRVRSGAVAGARITLGALRAGFGRIVGSETHHARGRRSLARGQGALAAVVGRHASSYVPRPARRRRRGRLRTLRSKPSGWRTRRRTSTDPISSSSRPCGAYATRDTPSWSPCHAMGPSHAISPSSGPRSRPCRCLCCASRCSPRPGS